jgi:hypothetical protein
METRRILEGLIGCKVEPDQKAYKYYQTIKYHDSRAQNHTAKVAPHGVRDSCAGKHGIPRFHEPRFEYNNYADATKHDTHQHREPRLRPKETTVPHEATYQTNPPTHVMTRTELRPTIHDNRWIHITITQQEMLQLHIYDIIITVHDLSPNACETQHDHEDEFVTMQSVGSDNMPLHRHDFACPHHLSTVSTVTFHSAHSYYRMNAIEISTMDGVSRSQQLKKDAQLHNKWH